MKCGYPEQVAHFFGVGQAAMRGDMRIERRTFEPRGQRAGPFGDAEPFQKHALRHRPGAGGGHARARQRLEIDMGGEIGRARLGQRVDLRVAAHSLKAVASRCPTPPS